MTSEYRNAIILVLFGFILCFFFVVAIPSLVNRTVVPAEADGLTEKVIDAIEKSPLLFEYRLLKAAEGYYTLKITYSLPTVRTWYFSKHLYTEQDFFDFLEQCERNNKR